MKQQGSCRMGLVWLGVVLGILVGGSARADLIVGQATNLGPPFNTTYGEYDSCISADGCSLFFASDRPGGFGGEDIWVTTRATPDNPWEDPANLGATVNTPYRDADPSFSTDGLSLYFRSNRPGGFGGEDVWVTTRATTNDSWGEPVNLGPPVNSSYAESDPSISADGLSLYFSEWANVLHPRPGGYGSSDIWVATRPTKEGPWNEPVNLGPKVNTGAADFMQGISTDGLVLFFASDREGGFGMFDLYMTRRATTSDPWGESVNLGPSVNSWEWDVDPEISADGSILYFDSWRSGAGDGDLWQARILPAVDFNGDGKVDSFEVCRMADHWGTDDTICDIGPMPWGDGVVDVQDLTVLAGYVGKEVDDPTLVAHWALDETEGIIAYDNVGESDGEVMGGAIWQPSGGMIGGAVLLDGVDDCVSTKKVPDPGKGPLSVFSWVKGGGPGQVLVSQVLGANWLMADVSGGRLMTDLKPWGRGGNALVSETVITDGNWHRVGLVWDGTNRILYVDDLAVAADTPSALVRSNGGLNIGCDKSLAPGSFWCGLIDEVRVYNRAVKP